MGLESRHATETMSRPDGGELVSRLGNQEGRSDDQSSMNRTSRSSAALAGGLLSILLVASACGGGDDDTTAAGEEVSENVEGAAEAGAGVSIADAWSREPAEGQTVGAVYGVITNGTDAEITLVGASSPVGERVEIHETLMDDEGVMTMQEREDGFAIPAGGELALEPGGSHVMIFDIDAATYPNPVEVTLEFDDGSTLDVSAEVRPIGDAGMDMDHSDMDMDDDS